MPWLALTLAAMLAAQAAAPSSVPSQLEGPEVSSPGPDAWHEDALASKLFLSGTGRSLRRGQVYAGVYQILVPVLHVGVADRISVGIGKPFFIFSPDVWIVPKVQVFRSARTNVAAGVLHFSIARRRDVRILFGAGTFGTADRAVTVGGGWTPGSGAPVLILGAERRTSRRLKAITENFLFADGAAVMLGVRVVGDRTFFFEAGGVLALVRRSLPMPGLLFSFIWAG
jgi:hypothetical protein